MRLVCLPRCRKWRKRWAVRVGRNWAVGEKGELAIVSPFPWKCVVTCLAWGHWGDEVLQRARARGELQGAEGDGVRACFVGKWAEGMGGKDYIILCDQRKDFVCLFHQELHLLSGLDYTTSSQTEISKVNAGSFSFTMIKQQRFIKLPKVSD